MTSRRRGTPSCVEEDGGMRICLDDSRNLPRENKRVPEEARKYLSKQRDLYLGRLVPSAAPRAPGPHRPAHPRHRPLPLRLTCSVSRADSRRRSRYLLPSTRVKMCCRNCADMEHSWRRAAFVITAAQRNNPGRREAVGSRSGVGVRRKQSQS